MSITHVETQEFVYDLCVAESECFAVNHGIVVHNTFLHQSATVRPGQTFKKGDLLARSNYTDHEGTTALGMNARVAYLPDEGYNYEDAISISESFARRMRSQHAYQHQHEWEPGDHQGKKAFISMFPSQYTKKQLDKFDDSGVVKQGETLHFGDPMILIASERERNKKSLVRSRTSFSDKSITWEHHSPGIVTDVVQTAKGPAVVVKSFAEKLFDESLTGAHPEFVDDLSVATSECFVVNCGVVVNNKVHSSKMELPMQTFYYRQHDPDPIHFWLHVTRVCLILLKMLFGMQLPFWQLCDVNSLTDTSVNYTFTSQL